MILTLRSRLTLLHTAVFAVLLLAMAVVSYQVLAYQLDADVSANLLELTSGLHGYLRFQEGQPAVVFDTADAAAAAFVEQATRYYQVFEAGSGALVVQSDALRPLGLDFTPDEVRQFAERPSVFDVQTDYGRIRLSNSVLNSPRRSRYLLQVGVTLAPMDRALGRFLALLALGVPAGLVAAFLIGRVMAGIALRPLTQLAEATRSVGVQQLLQLPVRGAGDELDDVAMAFNETLRRLDRSIGEMRQFSAALAHELRTPLTALRGEIELAMLKSGVEAEGQRLGSQLEEIDRLKRLIDRVLLLARAEAGEIPLAREPVHLGAVVQSLVDQVEPIAAAKGLQLESDLAENPIVIGDAQWLERAVLNLLDNAIKFTPVGGRVVVTLARGRTGAALTVRDSGIGIDPTHATHVFEPFFRADSARSSGVEGTGLGLSLAKWVVDRHHGRIEIESRPGQGSAFVVTLPLAG